MRISDWSSDVCSSDLFSSQSPTATWHPPCRCWRDGGDRAIPRGASSSPVKARALSAKIEQVLAEPLGCAVNLPFFFVIVRNTCFQRRLSFHPVTTRRAELSGGVQHALPQGRISPKSHHYRFFNSNC